jgi:phenylalanyl-tRNA synthetase alpha chain
MFGSLNFPEGHPARDDYDTFITEQTDADGKPFIAPAHTSTMQNRVLVEHKEKLENGEPIAVVIPGRVFRNEDLDARHEHTFYQLEGVYVGKGVHAGNLIATLKTFLQTYYGKELEVKTQPFYFPFTEPSFEFALSCPFCDKKGCSTCSQSGWIELLGCGMIHPNVLHAAGIDPQVYTGFAWGGGIERLGGLGAGGLRHAGRSEGQPAQRDRGRHRDRARPAWHPHLPDVAVRRDLRRRLLGDVLFDLGAPEVEGVQARRLP